MFNVFRTCFFSGVGGGDGCLPRASAFVEFSGQEAIIRPLSRAMSSGQIGNYNESLSESGEATFKTGVAFHR